MYMTKEETEARYGPMVCFYKEDPDERIWHTYPMKENFVTYFLVSIVKLFINSGRIFRRI